MASIASPFTGYTNGLPTGTYDPGNLTTKGGLRKGFANQYGQNSLLQAGQQQQRQTETGSLIPGYQSMLDSGYSPLEKSAINQSTLGGITSAYGGAQDAAKRRMAATGNSAGYGSFLGTAARGKASDLAGQNLQNQKAFADEAQKRKLAGLQGLAGLYGIDTSFLSSLGQQQLGTLGIGSNVQAGRKGVLGNINGCGKCIQQLYLGATMGMMDNQWTPMQDFSIQPENAPYGMLSGASQSGPARPSFLDSFQAGMKQRKPGQSPLLSGLAGYAGGGGFGGAVGNVAKFLL